MPPIPKRLRLDGSLFIGSRKYERYLTPKYGGRHLRDMIELHMGGRAPGGLAPMLMQVSIVEYASWLLKNIDWLRGIKRWSQLINDKQQEEAASFVKSERAKSAWRSRKQE